MGEARRRRAAGLVEGARPNPPAFVPMRRHVLALQDRRMEKDATGEIVFSDHSAKPGRYASADLRTLYQWDGTAIRRLDRATLKPHNEAHS